MRLRTFTVLCSILFLSSLGEGFRAKPLKLGYHLHILHSDNENNSYSKILFNIAEVVGSLISLSSKIPSVPAPSSSSSSIVSISSIAETIKDDYERLFWVQGEAEWDIWSEDCTFADPFSSFGGNGSLQRFKTNAKNLGSLVVDPVGKVRSFAVSALEDTDKEALKKYTPTIDEIEFDSIVVVKVGWSFTGKLKLPWNPILSASGLTSHFIRQDTGKIFLYQETWKSKPLAVVARLFTPTKSHDTAKYDFM